MKRWCVGVLIGCALALSSPQPSIASMGSPESGSYDRLVSYQRERVDVVWAGIVAFAVPGLEQFKRGSVLEGSIQAAVEIGGLFFLLRFSEEHIGGDTFQELTVNWLAAAVLALNHIYSAASTAAWGTKENARLRLQYGIDRIVIGLEF